MELKKYHDLRIYIPELPPERRVGGERLLALMRQERKKLSDAFSELSILSPVDDPEQLSLALSSFCGLLAGYIGLTQIAAFQRIANGEERREGTREIGELLYPRIQASTSAITKFIRRHGDGHYDAETFGEDLARVRDHIGERLKLENSLVVEICRKPANDGSQDDIRAEIRH